MEKPPLEEGDNTLESQESIKVDFVYDRDSDKWCLLYKGNNSYSSEPTSVYKELINFAGENPSTEKVGEFIDKFIEDHKIDIPGFCENLKKEWSLIEREFHQKASEIFGEKLTNDITVYLTINTRCPYSIENSSFFVSLINEAPTKTIMHELLHFYTWQKFGKDFEDRLGREKYNDIKEALTEMLNLEFKEIMSEGAIDRGYIQHEEIRKIVNEEWKRTRDIEKVWTACEKVCK